LLQVLLLLLLAWHMDAHPVLLLQAPSYWLADAGLRCGNERP
jgi:hypothetical protein